jgi:ribosomal protein L19
LIQRLKQKLKTLPSLSIEVNLKYSKAKFKPGDEVKVSTSSLDLIYQWSEKRYAGMEGVVLEVANHSSHLLVYQVSIDMGGFEHIQYFGEDELDYTLQRKRDDRTKNS